MPKQKHKEYDNQNRSMIEFYKGLTEEDLDRFIEIEENKIKNRTPNKPNNAIHL